MDIVYQRKQRHKTVKDSRGIEVDIILPPDLDERKKEEKALREYELENHKETGYR